jgi:uncharacterized phage infection (PIP) family protein YhgE
MKRLLFLLSAIAVTVAGLIALPQPAGATAIPPTETPRIPDKRCVLAKGRIANMAETFKAAAEQRATSYNNVHERTTARVTVLKQKKYDTGKLESHLQTLNNQVKEYQAKSDELYNALGAARDAACGDDEGAFTSALASARDKLKAAREASQTVHKTLQDSIAADLKAAATWIKDN